MTENPHNDNCNRTNIWGTAGIIEHVVTSRTIRQCSAFPKKITQRFFVNYPVMTERTWFLFLLPRHFTLLANYENHFIWIALAGIWTHPCTCCVAHDVKIIAFGKNYFSKITTSVTFNFFSFHDKLYAFVIFMNIHGGFEAGNGHSFTSKQNLVQS